MPAIPAKIPTFKGMETQNISPTNQPVKLSSYMIYMLLESSGYIGGSY
jgi:hypothetical protein